MTKKLLIISANAVVSLTMAATGLTRMILRDPLLGGGYEFSTLLWITGLITLFLIPLEICIIKPFKRS
ncbi:MAG: hypothetical protein Q8O55_03190 [Dehalococcoidales bacterium]|nr:hypothetical protein [Dehalococcoidales bacterium]